ncbi:MAG TPA: nicotinate-nucleotide adenylyltransferase [Rhizomicrobium sp.]|nr:nicotinate-nucleotide adenylyltransferase [Rhizomicrobium sp.]
MKRKPFPWIKPPGPIAPGLKIGLLGGSFNPAHAGHIHISDIALKRLGLDFVWWLVAPQNPLKPAQGMAPLHRRVEFAEEKTYGHPRIEVMDIERALGTRYTIDTLIKLKRRFPGVHFVWLMGTDNLEQFRRWKRWQDIVQAVPIAVVTRPGTVMAMLHAKPAIRFCGGRTCNYRGLARAKPPAVAMVDGPRNPLSATAIREACARSEIFVQVLPA